jgi:uncharacterized membrane protein
MAVLRALGLASIVSCGMVAARLFYSAQQTYLTLCWNLVLAWVPLGLSMLLARRHQPGRRAGRIGSLALGAVWLAFFPNAPYMVTDFVHLFPRSPIPLWFDAILVFAFAFTGLGLGFMSLLLVHGIVRRSRGAGTGWLFVATVATLTGFGVYLGRFQRWNSWDLVARPHDLFASVLREILHPASTPHSLGMTVIFGGFFATVYLVLFRLTHLGQGAAEVQHADAGFRSGVSANKRPSSRSGD